MKTIINNDEANTELSLAKALRDAKLDESFRLDSVYAIREAEIARLSLLSDKLAPIFAEISPSIDLFDVGIVTGNQPRLWIDMVSFVEMGADKRTYRMFIDSRSGRVLNKETADIDIAAKAVLDYVARRLIAREQLLAMPLPSSIFEVVTLPKAPVTQAAEPLDFNFETELETTLTKAQIVEEVTQNAISSIAGLRKQVFNTAVEAPLAPKSYVNDAVVFTKPEPQTGAAGYKDFLSAAKAAAREEANKSATIRAKLQNTSNGSPSLLRWFK